MRNSAFLIYGSEFRFRKKILLLKRLLELSGTEVQIVSFNDPFLLLKLTHTIAYLKENQTFLFVFHGHGHPNGWEGGTNYQALAKVLAFVRGNLLVINDTCFGLLLLKHLQKNREHSNTCFISAWDSATVCYGGPTQDAIDYWKNSKIVEDCVSANIHLTDDRDTKVPVQQHWGSRFESHFFPPCKEVDSSKPSL